MMGPPLPLLYSLHRSVQAALAAGRVGVPVFVRCVAHTAPDCDRLTEALCQAVAVAGEWLGAPARRVYAQGSREARQITATVQYAGGQNALVSVDCAPADGAPCIDLMLFGNTGAIYHEGAALPAAIAALDGPSGELPGLPVALRRAIEESLRAGAPVAVESDENG